MVRKGSKKGGCSIMRRALLRRLYPRYFLKVWLCLFAGGLIALGFFGVAEAEEEDKEPLRVCTQNLYRFGAEEGKKKTNPEKQKSYLATRIKQAGCQVVAFQEVWGETEKAAKKAITPLVSEINQRTGKKFKLIFGDSLDSHIRNAFLVAEDLGRVVEVRQYLRSVLPKLQPLGPAPNYTRGPVGILLELAPRFRREGKPARLYLVTMHFKSKANGWKDPTGTEFETLRMEMAAGLYRDVAEDVRRFGRDTLVFILGDTNSDWNSASAEILQGVRELKDFSKAGGCRLNDHLEAVCPGVKHRPLFVPLFSYRRESSGDKAALGSYRYRGKWQQIDEILIQSAQLDYVLRSTGTPAIGMKGKVNRGSDHLLLWVEVFPDAQK